MPYFLIQWNALYVSTFPCHCCCCWVSCFQENSLLDFIVEYVLLPAALCECGVSLLWRSWKRIAAPFKAQGRSLALSDNCSQWSPTCNICWSDKIRQGWNCLGMYWLTWNLVSFPSWRGKRVFTDKMQEVEFHKEGCHCDCSLLHCHGDRWMSWAALFWWKQLNLLEGGRGWGSTDSGWEISGLHMAFSMFHFSLVWLLLSF